MKKGYPYIESEFYMRMNSIVNSRVKLQRDGKIYDGTIKKQRSRFYLIDLSKREIRIKPTDKILSSKIEKLLK